MEVAKKNIPSSKKPLKRRQAKPLPSRLIVEVSAEVLGAQLAELAEHAP